MLKGMDLLGFIVRHAEGDEVIRLAAKSGIKGEQSSRERAQRALASCVNWEWIS